MKSYYLSERLSSSERKNQRILPSLELGRSETGSQLPLGLPHGFRVPVTGAILCYFVVCISRELAQKWGQNRCPQGMLVWQVVA